MKKLDFDNADLAMIIAGVIAVALILSAAISDTITLGSVFGLLNSLVVGIFALAQRKPKENGAPLPQHPVVTPSAPSPRG